MNTSRGFTLLELLIAMSFSLGIIATLFSSFFHMNRISLLADQKIDTDIRISIISNQVSKDLSGIFVPTQAISQATAQSPNEKVTTPKSPNILKNIFYEKKQDTKKNLSLLTFITNNPLNVYQKKKNGATKPLIVRVIYRLIKDTNIKDKESFILTRQEGTQLDLDFYKEKQPKSPLSYELANGIKSIELSYIVLDHDSKKTDEKDSNIRYKIMKEWPVDKPPLIPAYVILKIALWQTQYQADRIYTITCAIEAFEANKDLFFTPKEQKDQLQATQPKSTPVSSPERTNLPSKINGRVNTGARR